MRKIPFAGIELTSQRIRGYMVPLSYRGDRSDGLDFMFGEKHLNRGAIKLLDILMEGMVDC